MNASKTGLAGYGAKNDIDDMSGFVLLPRKQHESARIWCYRVILHNIVHLCLPPGACLAEIEMRRLMKVSSTPVREALMQLAQEKFVTIVPQKGTYISRIDLSQVLVLRYIRRCADAEAVREACGKTTPEILSMLNECLKRQQVADASRDFEAFIEADDEMHRLLYRAAGREEVWDFFDSTNLQHLRSRILRLKAGRSMVGIIREHEEIIAGLRKGDPEQAEAGVRKHLCDSTWNADSVQEKYPDYIDLPRG